MPKELLSFLRYVTDSTDTYVERAGDVRLERIHERIKALKQSKILEEGYMQLGELLKQEHDEGHEEGYKKSLLSGNVKGISSVNLSIIYT